MNLMEVFGFHNATVNQLDKYHYVIIYWPVKLVNHIYEIKPQ